MIEISISGESRPLSSANRNWIKGRMTEIRQKGESLSVKVVIEYGPQDITLLSGDAHIAGRVSNHYAKEQEIINMWKEHRMHTEEFDGDNLCEFLYRVSQWL